MLRPERSFSSFLFNFRLKRFFSSSLFNFRPKRFFPSSLFNFRPKRLDRSTAAFTESWNEFWLSGPDIS